MGNRYHRETNEQRSRPTRSFNNLGATIQARCVRYEELLGSMILEIQAIEAEIQLNCLLHRSYKLDVRSEFVQKNSQTCIIRARRVEGLACAIDCKS